MKTSERLTNLPTRLEELSSDFDLIALFGEMAGYKPEDIEKAAIRQNTNTIADNVASRIQEYGQFSDLLPNWQQDYGVGNKIKDRLTRGFWEYRRGMSTGSIRQAQRFKDEEAYLRYLAGKAYKDYHREAKLRARATRKEPERRNSREKELATCHPLSLTKKQFIETFSQSHELRPFRVLWHLAHDQ